MLIINWLAQGDGNNPCMSNVLLLLSVTVAKVTENCKIGVLFPAQL